MSSHAQWNVDAAHSGIQFTVRHMVVSKVRGRFAAWTGTLDWNEADPSASQVEANIDAASIDTGVADRDAHLRSADFLDVARFPQISYKSRKIEAAGKGRLRVTGDLTVHGVTREVPLDVEILGRGKDPWGKQRTGFSATASIDRKEFGLKWNQVLEAGGVLVGERIDVEIEVQAVLAEARQTA